MKLCTGNTVRFLDPIAGEQAAIVTHVTPDDDGNVDTRNGAVVCDLRVFPRTDGPKIKNNVAVYDNLAAATRAAKHRQMGQDIGCLVAGDCGDLDQ